MRRFAVFSYAYTKRRVDAPRADLGTHGVEKREIVFGKARQMPLLK
jgi:hypothetical protein